MTEIQDRHKLPVRLSSQGHERDNFCLKRKSWNPSLCYVTRWKHSTIQKERCCFPLLGRSIDYSRREEWHCDYKQLIEGFRSPNILTYRRLTTITTNGHQNWDGTERKWHHTHTRVYTYPLYWSGVQSKSSHCVVAGASNVSHFVVTTTACSLALETLSMSSVSTHFCTRFACKTYICLSGLLGF